MLKPDYKNWVPRGLIAAAAATAFVSLAGAVVFGTVGAIASDTVRWGMFAVLLIIFFAAGLFFAWCVTAYRAFSYNGRRKMSKQIIDGIAKYINLPEQGTGLDVGCGSGALTIACAKRNPQGTMTGVDYWGKEYASFSKPLCESNAVAEGVENVFFAKGNAIKLNFADETFDAVTSNYVYHNISVPDRKKLLEETLRVLKKGGVFAIHDIMSKSKYGDMQDFVNDLKRRGFEKVELIDTTNGIFMSPMESKRLMLSGSMLLIGKK